MIISAYEASSYDQGSEAFDLLPFQHGACRERSGMWFLGSWLAGLAFLHAWHCTALRKMVGTHLSHIMLSHLFTGSVTFSHVNLKAVTAKVSPKL